MKCKNCNGDLESLSKKSCYIESCGFNLNNTLLVVATLICENCNTEHLFSGSLTFTQMLRPTSG